MPRAPKGERRPADVIGNAAIPSACLRRKVFQV